MTNEERVEKLTYAIWDFNSESGEYPEYRDAVSKMLLAYADEIRRECADGAFSFIIKKGLAYFHQNPDLFEAAILGTEPAREGSE